MTNEEKKYDVEKKPIYEKWWLGVMIVVVLSAIIGISINQAKNPDDISAKTNNTAQTKNGNADNTSKQTETHLYDNANVEEIMYSYLPEKIGEDYVDDMGDAIGEYSIIRADSIEVTNESLADWYFHYVIKNDFAWCMILYTDKNDNSGAYAVEGLVKKNVIFEQAEYWSGADYVYNRDEHGNYILGDSSDSTIYYVPTNEGTLISSATFVEQVKGIIQDVISSKDESIIDVVFQDRDLCVYVDFTKKDLSPLALEDLAFSRTSSITDAILELREYDDLWETITVDFGQTGHITNSKENMGIKDDDIWWEIIKAEGCNPESEENAPKRYFFHENFILE